MESPWNQSYTTPKTYSISGCSRGTSTTFRGTLSGTPGIPSHIFPQWHSGTSGTRFRYAFFVPQKLGTETSDVPYRKFRCSQRKVRRFGAESSDVFDGKFRCFFARIAEDTLHNSAVFSGFNKQKALKMREVRRFKPTTAGEIQGICVYLQR